MECRYYKKLESGNVECLLNPLFFSRTFFLFKRA